MAQVADNIAAGWLPSDGEPAAHVREQHLLRHILLSGAAGSLTLPFALLPVLGPAVALPAGVGTALAASLLAASLASYNMRKAALARTEAPVAANISGFDGRLIPGLLTIHDPAGVVTAVSGRDREAYLAKIDSPAGKGFIDHIHVSDRIAFFRALDDLRQGGQQADVELRMAQILDGSKTQFLSLKVMMTALRDADGAFLGFAAQSLDNRDMVASRTETDRYREEAESANEAKARFLAAVSHELRTPLNAILGFSDVLAGEYFGKLENDQQREYVGLINQSGQHLLGVVNSMLDMSKIEAGHYALHVEPFPIRDIAMACEAMLELQARQKKVTLTFRVARNAGEVVADPGALKQILINLVGNAIKFTDVGGVVCVDIAVRDNDLELVVSDTGIGIPREKIVLLGRPFMQVDNEYTRKFEGTGLGLSLVKGLVALHGGVFKIDSEFGHGTVVTVTMPADGSGANAFAEANAADGAVEFPPRLQRAAKPIEENGVIENAEAKSA
ncbi:HAMP domain-containing sensor histidine kinase [Rhizobium sp. L1K21]|uniref:sensor histidine kinase n=1 Tax=Rhizobium sp. L1K21 TaxID=2954933 RepID=UPI002093D96E|nr:ATP-binding protein [Rhizobium sp. L1K21]MCO6186721.1 ATP-binding protein [Rhizobium sp. L1K21]